MDRKHLWKVAYKLRLHVDPKDDRFVPVEHYFDDQDNEIAMIYCAKTRKESVVVFDPPRNWPKEFKDMYATTTLRKSLNE